MPGCSAVGCSISRETELRMFRFPCEENRRAIWIAKVYDSSCNAAVSLVPNDCSHCWNPGQREYSEVVEEPSDTSCLCRVSFHESLNSI
jgi:hypothetical protein